MVNDREKFRWNCQYSVGDEEIDKQHKKLFSIIDKVADIMEVGDEAKAQHACREGIKFFKNYTLNHFAHEEEFMRSLNYSGYERHKRIHGDLMNRLIPAMEQQLEEDGYSMETINHFLGICAVWLGMHIKTEDMAIVNENHVKPVKLEIVSQQALFGKVLQKVAMKLYKLELEPITNHYMGWDFGKAIFHEMTYVSNERKAMHIIFAMEEKLALSITESMLGMKFKRVDSFLLPSIKEAIEVLGREISLHLGVKDDYKSRSGIMLRTSEFEEIFLNKTLLYSTLFKSQLGNFVCSIYER